MTQEFETVIGLEIHIQLQTRTKMFCGCALSFGEEPNTRTCPVCLGLPGALPVTNARAVHYGLMIGTALGSELAPRSIFHRKNYFYPDSPKGYQISQFDEPLCSGGRLGEVRIHRVHLEEDAAKLTHVGASGRIHGSDASVVDFNRGGTPLAEIVTEPDVRSAEQASEWLRLLRTTLRQLGVSDVNMEEGSLRCDANISIRPAGQTELGTKTELKNMNSFRFIERGIRAIDFLLRFLAFNIAPTVIELLLAAGVLGFKYGWMFSAIAAGTVIIYAWATFGVTEWRLKYRRDMNEADTEAAGRAVDSLLNFETVKSFAAETRESERYDRALSSYATAAVRAYTSLVMLNIAQGVIMTIGLVAMVIGAGWLVARPCLERGQDYEAAESTSNSLGGMARRSLAAGTVQGYNAQRAVVAGGRR